MGGSCQGSDPRLALQYLGQKGVASESAYSYTAGSGHAGRCHPFRSVAHVSNVQAVNGAARIVSALQHQVVSVAFRLSERGSPFMGYHSGVYDRDCGSGAGHAVAAVGYSSDYWIIRNSWGSSWGQHGYIYFKKGANLCGIESHGTIARVSRSNDETAKGTSNSECDTEYAAFLKSFPQKVPSADRKANFCSNFDRIAKHNSGNAQWSMGVNEFSDWVASGVDHRSKMPAVKNQKSCGSCWAFSAIDVVDFFGGSHSEEELIDCFKGSCQGSDPRLALQYLSQKGVASGSNIG